MSELVEYGRDKFGNHANDVEMVKFWENTGLLEGLENDLKLGLSKHLDDVAIYLIELNLQPSTTMKEGIDVISFPAIRRIYSNAKEEDKLEILSQLDVRVIVRTLMITYENLHNVMVSIYGDKKNVDIAAEVVCILSEQIYRSYTWK